jgi:hypothetical protein
VSAVYERLERESAGLARDLTATWDRLRPLEALEGRTLGLVEQFAAGKRITLDGLAALDTRWRLVGRGPELELAWAGWHGVNGRRVVTAVKFRNLATGARVAENGSVWLEPIIAGDRLSLDWFVAEGETDGARLVDLVGEVAAVLVLPTGALPFRREWAAMIPRGATVHLAHDADKHGNKHGDKGAAKAAGMLGRSVRVRPPDAKDWCEWNGDREAFYALVATSRAGARGRLVATPLTEIGMRSIEWFERPLWQRSAFQLVSGPKGARRQGHLPGRARSTLHACGRNSRLRGERRLGRDRPQVATGGRGR